MKDNIVKNLENLKNYSWLPEKIEQQLGVKTEDYKTDEFGVKPRLGLIKNKLSNLKIKNIVDIGGNSGYFSLELLDKKIISESTVVDFDSDVLNFGDKISKQLRLENSIKFIKKSLSLNNIDELPEADLVLCLNLIHHAGILFDEDIVKEVGWSEYAVNFLSVLRKKYKYAVIGVGFKSTKPANWPVIDVLRPIYLSEIISRAGWKVMYDANINDLVSFGEKKACGIRTRKTPSIFLAEAICRILGYRMAKLIFNFYANKNKPKIEKYHIYILQ